MDLSRVPLLQDRVVQSAAILLLSYVIGALNIQVSFRLLKGVGDVVDLITSRLAGRSPRIRSVIEWCSRRLNIFNTTTLEADRTTKCPLSAVDQAILGKLASLSDVCKMELIGASPKLTQETLEVEADLNYHAGMFLPMAFLAFGMRSYPPLVVGALVLIAINHALRFQHMRHFEVEVIYLAYRMSQKIGKTGQNDHM